MFKNIFQNDVSSIQETKKGDYLGGWSKQTFQCFISSFFVNYDDVFSIKNEI